MAHKQNNYGPRPGPDSRYNADENLQINVVVAVDNEIKKHHEDIQDVTHGLESYIESLINYVDSIFHHSTLERRIRIHLLRLKSFSEHETNQLVQENSPNDTLTLVCDRLADKSMGQYSRADRRGSFEEKDISIFLTRKKFGPAGKC